MRTQFVIGLLVLVVAIALAEKKKSHETADLSETDDAMPSQPIMDGKVPPHQGAWRLPPPGGFGQGSKGNKKNPRHGAHPGKAYQDTNAIRGEIMRIKNSDIPEEEKAARLKAFREHVRSGGMMENMPEEVRERQQQLREQVHEIMTNEDLTQEEKQEQVSAAREKFSEDMYAIRGSASPEQLAKMREEQKKTIEGHTAAAMAARRLGHHDMAKKFSRKAREAAQGGRMQQMQGAGRPANKARRARMPSLSEPDF